MPPLSALLGQADRIVLISHINPDGDATGSLLSLKMALASQGKQVTAVLADPVPRIFQFLKNAEEIQPNLPNLSSIDLCVLMDANDVSRSGFTEELKQLGEQGKLACIDHHPKGDASRYSQAILHDEKVSSTAELTYQLIVELGSFITPDIATALLTGIYTDTAGFQHPTTTNQTLQIAAELMRRGGKLHKIVEKISLTKSMANLRLLGLALERLRLTRSGRCAVSLLTHQDILTTQATQEDLSGIVGNINTLPGVQFCLLLSEFEYGTIRGTLRTGESSTVNVSTLAKILGGGGHPRASGFSLPGHLVINQDDSWKVVAQSEEKG